MAKESGLSVDGAQEPASKRACSSAVRSAQGIASRRPSGIGSPLSTETP